MTGVGVTRLKRAMPGAVVTLGFASFFTDISSEMIYPLLPVFLAQVLGAGAMSLGVVEGVAESTAALFKVWSGVLTDKAQGKFPKKSLIVSGYSVSSLLRPLIGLATGPWMVVLLRFGDRVGKGIRTSPRDAMIAEVTAPEQRGAAFGLHRAMDHAGSVVGPLVAWMLMNWLGLDLRTVFLAAIVPGAVAVLILARGLPGRAKSAAPATKAPGVGASQVLLPWRDIKALPQGFKRFSVAVGLFTLGNATDAFLLLRLGAVGLEPATIVLLWSTQSAVKAAATWFGGRLADRLGFRPMLIAGWAWYAVCYLAMAFAADSEAGSIAVFLAYGLYYGLTEPAEKAIVAAAVPPEQRGIAFGCFHFVVGMLLLPASLLFGGLWQAWSPEAAFCVGAALAGLGSLLLLVWAKPGPGRAAIPA